MRLIEKWEINGLNAQQKKNKYTKDCLVNVWVGGTVIPCIAAEGGNPLVLKGPVIPWGNSTYVYDEVHISEGCLIVPIEKEEE